MGTICIYALFFIAAWGSIHGITGAVLKRKSEAYTGWGLLGLVSGILVMVFSCLQTGTVNTTYSLLATLFLLGSVSNMIAASLLQRTVLLYGYEQCNLKRIAADWLQARGRGEYHLFLADMKNSEYLRIISDALRIVHSVAVSLPRDYTFQVTDYGFLVDAFPLIDNSRYKILVAYPSLSKEKLQNLELETAMEKEQVIYVVSDNYGIKVTELLDTMSKQLLFGNNKCVTTNKK